MVKTRSHLCAKMSSSSTTTAMSTSCRDHEDEIEWEMRPGGMLVQKRNEKDDGVPPPLNVRLRVLYGVLRYEISVNSQATFGEVKKVLTGKIGLQIGDQKIIYKEKEKGNGEYLDKCGVKDRSKLILMEDPSSIERRYIEMRKNARIQTAYQVISNVSMEVDKLVEQVFAIEKSILNGVKVPEIQIMTLIEMLMRQAIKLDNISAEENVSTQKYLQSKRVQWCVETLDVLKISNPLIKLVVVAAKWETFDPPPTTSRWEFF
ncbi:PREDICTED: BAG family molecular chaperone regulator 1-like [Populus euphratica]|uniref:BAG family molecular chaperone regulator 1-like n=1 Tax=Populus euphratica TaxID=75702 RepID=A0AAJ6TP44_POPEU|nr:PREDICTED: BAG family molecular chaperone regulator 1-like [Populus euphratica]